MNQPQNARESKNLNWLLVPIASLAFAASGPATKIAVRELPVFQVVASRCAIAAIFLLLWLRRDIWKFWQLQGRSSRRLLIFAGLIFAIHLGFFVGGVLHTSYVAAMTLVAIEPVLVLLIGLCFFKIKTTSAQIVGISMTIIGALLVGISGMQYQQSNGHTIYGDLLLVAATLFYGIYYTINRTLQVKISPLPSSNKSHWCAAAIIFASATLCGTVAAFTLPGSSSAFLLPNRSALYSLLVLGIVATLIGHTLNQIAARKLHPALTALMSPGETVGAIALGMLLFSTFPTGLEILGGLSILFGALLVSRAN